MLLFQPHDQQSGVSKNEYKRIHSSGSLPQSADLAGETMMPTPSPTRGGGVTTVGALDRHSSLLDIVIVLDDRPRARLGSSAPPSDRGSGHCCGYGGSVAATAARRYAARRVTAPGGGRSRQCGAQRDVSGGYGPPEHPNSDVRGVPMVVKVIYPGGLLASVCARYRRSGRGLRNTWMSASLAGLLTIRSYIDERIGML